MSLKLSSALGFAARAGKVRAGDFTAEKLLKSGKAMLIVIDSTASVSTMKKWQNACENCSIKLIKTENPGHMMGKPDNKIFAVTDKSFCDLILQAFSENTEIIKNNNCKE